MDAIDVTVSAPIVPPGITLYSTATFLDAGSPVAPDSVDYKIDCTTNGLPVRPWTPAVPFTTSSVLIEATDTQLTVPEDAIELFTITWRATAGVVTLTQTATYQVVGDTPSTRPTTVIIQSTSGQSGAVSICNAALRKIGADRITDLNDNTNRARIMKERYVPVLEAELHRRRWKFSISRQSLPKLSDAPDSDYTNRYQLPIDYLRLIDGGDIGDAADMSDFRTFNGSPQYSIEGQVLLTNLRPPISIRYIARVTDVSLFNPSFKEALASRLAWETCEAITQSDSKRQLAWSDYTQSIREAMRANAIEAPSSVMADGSWILSRLQ